MSRPRESIILLAALCVIALLSVMAGLSHHLR
jgi:hypothetical protein